jgi:hypothetical protein
MNIFTRNITIRKDPAFDEAAAVVPPDVINRAVGYLSNWAIHSERYCRVDIWMAHSGDITAVYRNAKGEVMYEIGGILHIAEKQGSDGLHYYSFHS